MRRKRRLQLWQLMLRMVRVLLLATIYAPAMASAQQTLSPLPAFPTDGIVDGADRSLPGSDQFSAPPSAPCYWTVSSRALPQEPTLCASGRLGYYQRLENGRLEATSREAMVGQFLPGVPICIFIHGSFVDVDYHIRESAQTYDWIRRAAPQLPGHIIFYTWPSEAQRNALASANPIIVNERGHWAENNAFYLADLIAHLPPESPVCLVGHSHGARTAVATLHLVSGGEVAGKSYPYETGHRRYRAVLAAGAFDRHWLNPGERYDFAVRRVEGILNMVNRTDAALHFYPLRRIFSRKAITVTGLTRWDRARLGPQGDKVIDFDVTRLIGIGHFWPNYFEEPSLAGAIAPYVYFTDSHLNPTYTLAPPGEWNVNQTSSRVLAD